MLFLGKLEEAKMREINAKQIQIERLKQVRLQEHQISAARCQKVREVIDERKHTKYSLLRGDKLKDKLEKENKLISNYQIAMIHAGEAHRHAEETKKAKIMRERVAMERAKIRQTLCTERGRHAAVVLKAQTVESQKQADAMHHLKRLRDEFKQETREDAHAHGEAMAYREQVREIQRSYAAYHVAGPKVKHQSHVIQSAIRVEDRGDVKVNATVMRHGMGPRDRTIILNDAVTEEVVVQERHWDKVMKELVNKRVVLRRGKIAAVKVAHEHKVQFLEDELQLLEAADRAGPRVQRIRNGTAVPNLDVENDRIRDGFEETFMSKHIDMHYAAQQQAFGSREEGEWIVRPDFQTSTQQYDSRQHLTRGSSSFRGVKSDHEASYTHTDASGARWIPIAASTQPSHPIRGPINLSNPGEFERQKIARDRQQMEALFPSNVDFDDSSSSSSNSVLHDSLNVTQETVSTTTSSFAPQPRVTAPPRPPPPAVKIPTPAMTSSIPEDTNDERDSREVNVPRTPERHQDFTPPMIEVNFTPQSVSNFNTSGVADASFRVDLSQKKAQTRGAHRSTSRRFDDSIASSVGNSPVSVAQSEATDPARHDLHPSTGLANLMNIRSTSSSMTSHSSSDSQQSGKSSQDARDRTDSLNSFVEHEHRSMSQSVDIITPRSSQSNSRLSHHDQQDDFLRSSVSSSNQDSLYEDYQHLIQDALATTASAVSTKSLQWSPETSRSGSISVDSMEQGGAKGNRGEETTPRAAIPLPWDCSSDSSNGSQRSRSVRSSHSSGSSGGLPVISAVRVLQSNVPISASIQSVPHMTRDYSTSSQSSVASSISSGFRNTPSVVPTTSSSQQLQTTTPRSLMHTSIDSTGSDNTDKLFQQWEELYQSSMAIAQSRGSSATKSTPSSKSQATPGSDSQRFAHNVDISSDRSSDLSFTVRHVNASSAPTTAATHHTLRSSHEVVDAVNISGLSDFDDEDLQFGERQEAPMEKLGYVENRAASILRELDELNAQWNSRHSVVPASAAPVVSASSHLNQSGSSSDSSMSDIRQTVTSYSQVQGTTSMRPAYYSSSSDSSVKSRHSVEDNDQHAGFNFFNNSTSTSNRFQQQQHQQQYEHEHEQYLNDTMSTLSSPATSVVLTGISTLPTNMDAPAAVRSMQQQQQHQQLQYTPQSSIPEFTTANRGRSPPHSPSTHSTSRSSSRVENEDSVLFSDDGDSVDGDMGGDEGGNERDVRGVMSTLQRFAVSNTREESLLFNDSHDDEGNDEDKLEEGTLSNRDSTNSLSLEELLGMSDLPSHLSSIYSESKISISGTNYTESVVSSESRTTTSYYTQRPPVPAASTRNVTGPSRVEFNHNSDRGDDGFDSLRNRILLATPLTSYSMRTSSSQFSSSSHAVTETSRQFSDYSASGISMYSTGSLSTPMARDLSTIPSTPYSVHSMLSSTPVSRNNISHSVPPPLTEVDSDEDDDDNEDDNESQLSEQSLDSLDRV